MTDGTTPAHTDTGSFDDMAVSASSSTVINATPDQVLAVIADVESLVDWSSAHRAVTILEQDDQGRPLVVESQISSFGLKDTQCSRYSWSDNEARWELTKPSALQKSQDARYTVTEKDGQSLVEFELTVELNVPVPGMIVRKAQKSVARTAAEGLKAEVERRYA